MTGNMSNAVRFGNDLPVVFTCPERAFFPADVTIFSLKTVHAVHETHPVASRFEESPRSEQSKRFSPEIIGRKIGYPGIYKEDVHKK